MPRKTKAPAPSRKRDSLGRFVAKPVRIRDERGRFAKAKPAPKKKGVPSKAAGHPKRQGGAQGTGRAPKAPEKRPQRPKAAPLPVYTIQRQRGRTYIRDKAGRIVSREQAEKGRIVRIVREGKKLRALSDLTSAKPGKGHAPRPHGKFVKAEIFATSAARYIEDEAVKGRPMLVKWKGNVYSIRPQDAGVMGDVFRAIIADYVDEMSPYVASPQLRFQFVETLNGKRDYSLVDVDGTETLDDELIDELSGNDELQEAAHRFNSSMERYLDQVLKPTWKEEKPAPTKGKRTRKPPAKPKGGKKRRRK